MLQREMSKRCWLQRVRATVLLGLALTGLAQAQGLSRETVQQRSRRAAELFQWYYAAVYGTGAYRIGDESVSVVLLPMAYTVREPSAEDFGVKLTVPVSAALAQFDLYDWDLGNVRTAGLSVLPGVEIEIPLQSNWSVTPYANLGIGREFTQDTSALIYAAGVSTLYRVRAGGDILAALGAKFTYAGYRAGGESNTLGAVSFGGDLGVPVEVQIVGRPSILGAQLIGTFYFNRLDFLLPGSPTQAVSNEIELALTLGVRQPVDVFGMRFDRIGLGYRQGSNGLRGVRLATSFPF